MRLRSVTVLLCAIGAVIGALAGMVFLIAQGGFTGGPDALAFVMLFVAALVGAAVGAFIGPPIALGFLRHVPLWRAALETGIGASLGFAVGLLLEAPSILFGIGGAILAAIRLRNAYPRDAVSATLPNEELKPTATRSSLVE